MNLRYLQTAQPGIMWFRTYYRYRPQLDFTKALTALLSAERTLVKLPLTGTAFEDYSAVREYHIQGTAFSLLYTVHKQTIFVIDVRDKRGLRSAAALQLYTKELRRRWNISD